MMPYLRMATDLHGSPAERPRDRRAEQGFAAGSPVCRSILQTPSWYAQVEQELQAMPTIASRLSTCTRCCGSCGSTKRTGSLLDLRYAQAKEVSATRRRATG